MPRRPAITLVEVLVAIFVMGIGLIALLTLFPLGVLTMAVAIRDQRCGECAQNAGALAKAENVRGDGLVKADAYNPLNLPPASGYDVNLPVPVTNAFKNPLPGILTDTKTGPSYPLLVDPAGWYSTTSFPTIASGITVQTGGWVGGVVGVLSRRRTGYVANYAGGPRQAVAQFFTLWDDMLYDQTAPGQAETIAGTVARDTRYSWAYLLQQPNSNPSLTALTVVVFNKRPLSLNSSLALAEYVYSPRDLKKNIVTDNPTYYDLQNNTITIDYTNNVPPPLRPGDWILDVTLDMHWVNPANLAQNAILYPHAYQYMQCEVQGPLRGFDPTHSIGPAAAGFPQVPAAALRAELNMSASTFTGISVVMEGVAAVYDRGY